MKNSPYWMIVCVGLALAAVVLLPQFGVPLAGASLFFLVLMIGCCVLPMLFMMRAGSDGKDSSCCSEENESEQKSVGEIGKEKRGSKSCH